jgi:WD40 repeat protein
MVEWVTFSADSRMLAAGGDDRTVTLTDISHPERPAPLAPPIIMDNYVYSLAFAPDGRHLAVGTAGGLIYILDLTNRHHPLQIRDPLRASPSYVFTVTFSPDGTTLAAATADKNVRLWDIRDPEEPVPLGNPLTGPTNYVNIIAFSPDGRRIAAGSDDGNIWLYDLTHPSAPHTLGVLSATGARVLSMTYSPDGRILVGGGPQTVRLWDTDPTTTITTICTTRGDGLTAEEWSLYLPGTAYREPCSGPARPGS